MKDRLREYAAEARRRGERADGLRGIFCNAQLDAAGIRKTCPATEEALARLREAFPQAEESNGRLVVPEASRR